MNSTFRRIVLAFSLLAAACGAKAVPSSVMVDPSRTYQSMVGFGAALTDASAWLIETTLTPAQRAELLRSLFDPTAGAGLSYLRIPIGASDFSLTEFSLDDMPAGAEDLDMSHFSIAHDEAYTLPLLRQILKMSPRVRLMASPWSAPAWMKESGKMAGGRLKRDDQTYAAFADYLTRFVQAYLAAGAPIDLLTLQNEPWNDTANYPSMKLDPEDDARLAVLLGKRFKAAGIATKIVVWDHNWDHPEYPIKVLSDPAANPYIEGSAFHGYAGDVAAQLKVHDAYPDKSLYFTESSGGTWATDFASNLMWDMNNLLIGSTRRWARTVVKWNLALDEKNGPHLPGGPGNCRGIVTLNRQSGAVTREEEYYAFGQVARFVSPGAKRIESSDPASVAFANPDGTIALVLTNNDGSARDYQITCAGHALRATLPARSVRTFVWPASHMGPVRSWLTSGDRASLLAAQPDLHFD